VGGVVGMALGLSNVAGAATPSPNPSGTASRSVTSNENKTHEACESAAREAAEKSGRGFGGPGFSGGGSNENPAHEAGESAAREAQESAAHPTGAQSG
jgi:hypothetical protein